MNTPVLSFRILATYATAEQSEQITLDHGTHDDAAERWRGRSLTKTRPVSALRSAGSCANE